ncbi:MULTISPECIES: 4-(cytidine 5'-diphospho)-2-C-methyl-D-erythritol kinase [Lachnospiraceae]|jgi:4-diphosphocytidyl-2-C-methyl-D-erythritol kinase|uniref:4-diphosphocytidyl-2-C-methyl-D-erythritol kinase n=1 Tax=Faecalicatena acetigenes TaxID=2981790 RepID=A0ABT2TBA8_9FIRM|nr:MULTISPECIES: 4-(cytidine 5'-diphospho)-2-C-methyl-D-erythritol kinase [Lachnospiraceae]MCU6747116.1 4-(cytidine 5'-diphospho)-2-C-methyl-D-erythritol kinase [Faecalicatena acetigenes]RGT74167.1 4-(cytidine 5'-diphospho)-2-C-methyl-D-erythritol kinase [Ruminococcus sp. AF18-22]SCH66472.1 4-diphosphocytidyl-2-C-methyl-D-erythritol kinase [uncultured Clostridium sp.]
MRQIELKALAKINLGLDVLGKRENGYHDVRMIMQSIYLYDDVKIEKTEESGIFLETNLHFLPTDSSNIAYKAAQMLLEEFDISQGVKIGLNKHIPVAAGLAGGSSNAAAVLFGMNRLFALHLTQEELMERGVKLGADVPYCIMRGTVLAEGIGEQLHKLPAMPKCTVLIAKPPVSVSTKMVYEALDAKEILVHPDIDGLIQGLEQGSLRRVASCMGNVLEDVTIPMYPVIDKIKEEMQACGALNAMMSGSGPTVFGLFENRADARKAQARIREKALAKQVFVTNIHGVRGKQDGTEI